MDSATIELYRSECLHILNDFVDNDIVNIYHALIKAFDEILNCRSKGETVITVTLPEFYDNSNRKVPLRLESYVKAVNFCGKCLQSNESMSIILPRSVTHIEDELNQEVIEKLSMSLGRTLNRKGILINVDPAIVLFRFKFDSEERVCVSLIRM